MDVGRVVGFLGSGGWMRWEIFLADHERINNGIYDATRSVFIVLHLWYIELDRDKRGIYDVAGPF